MSRRWGCSTSARRTFHSSPSTSADFDRFDEPDVRGRVAGAATEQPRLGVQAGRAGLVGDLDLGAQLDQPVESPPFGRAHVGRRDDPQRRGLAGGRPATDQSGRLLLDDPQPVPLHERAEQIHPVGRRQLWLTSWPMRGWCRPLTSKRAGGERHLGSRHRHRWVGGVRRQEDLAQHVTRGDEVVGRVGPGLGVQDGGGDLIDQSDLPGDQVTRSSPAVLGQRAQCPTGEEAEVAGQDHLGIGRVESPTIDQLTGQVLKAGFQPRGDQPLLNPRLPAPSRHESRDQHQAEPGAPASGRWSPGAGWGG